MITFSDNDGKLFALALVSGIMVYVGRISTRLPDSRLMGLFLPWTVRDEETGELVNRILRQISLPLILLYIVCAWTFSDFVAVSIGIVLMWISIPGGVYPASSFIKNIMGDSPRSRDAILQYN